MFLIPAFMAMLLNPAESSASLLLIISFVLIFLAHQPAGKVLRKYKNKGTLERRSFYWVLLLGGSGALLSGFLIFQNQRWTALVLGAAVCLTLMIHLWMTVNKEAMSIPGELIGVLGLTAGAPFIYIYNHGFLDARGIVLWMLNFLYFSGSIFYIKLKLRIQPSHGEPGFFGKIKAADTLLLYSVLLILYLFITIKIRGYSWLFLLAFLPFFAKTVYGIINWNAKGKLKPRTAGLLELTYSLLFLILTLLAFHLPT